MKRLIKKNFNDLRVEPINPIYPTNQTKKDQSSNQNNQNDKNKSTNPISFQQILDLEMKK